MDASHPPPSAPARRPDSHLWQRASDLRRVRRPRASLSANLSEVWILKVGSAIGAVLVALALGPTSAVAGRYEVTTCGSAPGAVNHSWTSESNAPGILSTSSVCPPSGTWDGLGAEDALSA